MTKTISGTYSSTYTLTDQYTTVLGTGEVSVLLVNAIYGPTGGTAWTVTNSGSLISAGGYGFGVELHGTGANVTNNAGGVISGGEAGIYLYDDGTVVNHGAIRGIINLKGVILGFGGTVTNTGLSANISGYNDGVYLNAGGVLTNGAGATISGGDYGVYARQGIALLTNAGTIHGGTGAGIRLTNGAIVTNQATGQIIGDRGPGAEFISYSATLTNYGTIAGGALGQDAVLFAPGIGNLLVDEPGAVFIGTVDGGNTIGGILTSRFELASGASAGTLGGLGSNYIDFGQVTVDTGAIWHFSGANTLATGATLTDSGTLDAGSLLNNGVMLDLATLSAATLTGIGSVTIGSGSTLTLSGAVASGQTIDMTGSGDLLQIGGASAFSGTITGFGFGDIIDVQGIGLAQSAVKPVANPQELELFASTDGSGTPLFIFPNIASVPGGEGVVLSTVSLVDDGAGGTVVGVVCYLRGTRIRTDRGEVPIEELSIGDPVLTSDGRVMPVRWVGRNTVSTKFADPLRVLPIRIRAGALADHLPVRDLLVSPEHAVLVDDILVQAGALVNGLSIVRESNVAETFVYYHIELAEHALVLAEGTPAESFVDNIHRMAFDNWEEHEALYGDAPIVEMDNPRARSHRQVPMEIRARLLNRAETMPALQKDIAA